MRSNLYKFEIRRRSGPVVGHVVAPTEKQAAVMVIDHDLALSKRHLSLSLERIDAKLPPGRRSGLNSMLSGGRAGFASFISPVGWLLHEPVQQRLSFYRFFTPEGDETYVVAGSHDEAVDLYATTYALNDGEYRLFKFVDGLVDLSPEQRAQLENTLEFGPVGIATYDDRGGWSVRPPI